MDNEKIFEEMVVLSELELARLGGGEVAYIRKLTSDEAVQLFPAAREEIPEGINLFAVHAADGTPIALTDSHSAALAHVMEDDLEAVAVH